MGSSGGLTPDNIGVEYAGVVYGIAESPKEKGVIWAGTNDGLVQLTRDNGKTWTNLTKNLPNLPAWGSVRSIAPSRFDNGTAYLTVDFHQMNNRDPFVYRTTDYGQTFKMIVNGIPKSMLSYAKVIYEDPVRRGMLYLGTENAIYVSFDAGDNWQPLQNDLPHAPVSGIVVQEHFNDLVISTYGRGFWIMDDITALRALPDALASDANLFPLRPAYRFRGITAPSTPYDDPTIGENPQYGASINYYLKQAVPNGGTISIATSGGEVIRTMPVPGTAGLNRVYWDLRQTPTKEVRMRTNPLYGHELPLNADGYRTAGGGTQTILSAPGTYTVKLSIGGHDYSQPLTVRKDPHSGGTEADIQAQTQLSSDLGKAINSAVDAVNQLEYVRAQVQSTMRNLPAGDVKQAATELNEKLSDLEMNLVDLRITGGQDGVRYASKLLGKLGYLANGITTTDYRPTDQHVEIAKQLQERLKTHLSEQAAAIDKDVARFNEMLRRASAGQVITKAP
jgi:hypothetical protein